MGQQYEVVWNRLTDWYGAAMFATPPREYEVVELGRRPDDDYAFELHYAPVPHLAGMVVYRIGDEVSVASAEWRLANASTIYNECIALIDRLYP